MQRFIAQENIKRYKQMLSETSDESRISMLRQLLAEEERRLTDLNKERGITVEEVQPPQVNAPVR